MGQLRKVISTSNSVIIEKTHLLEFCLRLDQATKLRFDTILDKFDSLSKDCLFLLRVELRCHCLYFMDLAGGEGSYCLEQKASDPDAHISLMNQDLLLFEQLCDGSLSPIHSK